jgi:hypothetical protein
MDGEFYMHAKIVKISVTSYKIANKKHILEIYHDEIIWNNLSSTIHHV